MSGGASAARSRAHARSAAQDAASDSCGGLLIASASPKAAMMPGERARGAQPTLSSRLIRASIPGPGKTQAAIASRRRSEVSGVSRRDGGRRGDGGEKGEGGQGGHQTSCPLARTGAAEPAAMPSQSRLRQIFEPELQVTQSPSDTASPSVAGLSATTMPADFIASILSSAPPLPPATMAPAWPMRRPGGAVRPAMKPATGFAGPSWPSRRGIRRLLPRPSRRSRRS